MLDILAKAVYSSLFEGAAMPDGIMSKAFKDGALKGAIGQGLTFVEQNPNTGSGYAQQAREGHNIMWILTDNGYVGKVMDGITDRNLSKYPVG